MGCVDDEAFRTLGAQLKDRNDLERELDALHRNEPMLVNEEGQPFREKMNTDPEEAMHATSEELSDDIVRFHSELTESYGDQRSLLDDRQELDEANPTSEIQEEIGRLQEEL